ncbi:MAG: OpgC domain-containing protein [Anaerolineae bacterium]|nr:OpgC domain-containing protein [Anaerolineae bacterium]
MTQAMLASAANSSPFGQPSSTGASQRDLRFDLLRGYAVFVMVVNHIGGEHSWLYPITGGNQFYISAAEAFVFISGLVMGIVYARIAVRQGLRAVLLKSLHRARTLYLQTIGLTLLFAAASTVFHMPWGIEMPPQNLGEWLWGVVTLRQAYYLTDVLLLYTFLVVAAGPLLVLMARGFSPLVLLLSWGVWAVWQKNPGGLELPWPVASNTVFPATAWQVLFITGLVLGFHRVGLSRLLGRIPRWVILVGCGLGVAWFIRLYRTDLAFFDASPFRDLVIAQLYVKPNVGFGRLLVFAFIFSFAFALVSVGWRLVLRGLGWLLLPLGQHSLLAYGLHLFVVIMAVRLHEVVDGWTGDPSVQNAVLQSVGILTLWALVMARLHLPAYAQRWASRAGDTLRRLPPLAPRLGWPTPATLPLVAAFFAMPLGLPTQRVRTLAAPLGVIMVTLVVAAGITGSDRLRPMTPTPSHIAGSSVMEASFDDAFLDDFDAPGATDALQDMTVDTPGAQDSPTADEQTPSRLHKRRVGGPRSC